MELSGEALRKLLEEEKKKMTELQSRLDDLKAEQPEDDPDDEEEVERMRERNEQAQQMMTEDNERLLENLQMVVDNTAADKARVELDILHPYSAKFVRVSEKDVDPGLWKLYKESEFARMKEMAVLGQLRQQCEHVSTICALFGHRMGVLQVKAIREKQKLEMPPTKVGGGGPNAQRRRHSEVLDKTLTWILIMNY